MDIVSQNKNVDRPLRSTYKALGVLMLYRYALWETSEYMRREEVLELQYITPLENISSIFEHGILSHKLANELPHRSVAWNKMQDKRSRKSIPSGHMLHEYANLYICARNPMLYKVRSDNNLCILGVSPRVLDLPGVVIANSNAASEYVRFMPSPNGLELIDKDFVFAESWIHPDQIDTWKHKSAKCAEVLVPNYVNKRFLNSAYVSDIRSQEILLDQLRVMGQTLRIVVDEYLFFRRRR